MRLDDIKQDTEDRWKQRCEKFATASAASNINHAKIEILRDAYDAYKEEIRILKLIEKDPVFLAAITTQEEEDKIRKELLEKSKKERNTPPVIDNKEEQLPVVDL